MVPFIICDGNEMEMKFEDGGEEDIWFGSI